jgi:hypothetical protein
MLTEKLLQRIDQLLNAGKDVMATAYSTSGPFSFNYVDEAKMAGFRSASLSFIDRTYGSIHPHYIQFAKSTDNHNQTNVRSGISILEAIREEIAGGWLISVKSLISAELFADFLDMATHLLDLNYKDPAAVMAGSVLEEHLRQLCSQSSIAVVEDKDGKLVHIKADRLNADLTKSSVYSRLDQKNITAWLDLRNNAAHGKYDSYTEEQVRLMLMGITDFIARVPG